MSVPIHRLGDVAQVIRGVTYKKSDAAQRPFDGSVPLLRATNIGQGLDLVEGLIHVPSGVVKKSQMVKPGDIVVASSSGSLSVVGKSARVLHDWIGTFGAFCAVIRSGPQVDPRYLAYFVQSAPVRTEWSAAARGTNINNLKRSDLERTLVPVPSLDEQRRVVDLLEDHLSRLDAGVAGLSLATRNSKAMVKSLLVDLVPDPSAYPPDWRLTTVGTAGTVELGRQRHPDWHTGSNMKPYLRVANVFEDRIDARDLKEMHWEGTTFDRFRLHPGDVLLNEGQTPELLGRPAIYRGDPAEVAFTNSLIRFKAANDVLPEFALLVFRRHMHAGRFTKESRITTNIAHLSASRLKAVEFPVPPLDIQRAIVKTASERLDAFSKLDLTIAKEQDRAAALRRALLTAAYSGQLTGASSDMDRVEELAEA